MRRYRVLTWHVHGSYLYYLALTGHEIWLPVRSGEGRSTEGYHGRTRGYPWPVNVREVPAEQVKNLDFDLVLYQSRKNWLEDQWDLLSVDQRQLPKIYLEHDPPREHPTDTPHPVDDPGVLLAHVTPFNQLMWDSRRTPSIVIEHGVPEPPVDLAWTGELARGVTVINHLKRRGRRLGADVFDACRDRVPSDLVGMGWNEAGGIGEIPHGALPAFMARYRFFFNPIRYTSLGLSICEAMMTGLPVVGLATTELVTVIRDGESGILSTRPEKLVDGMRELIRDPAEARRMGEAARRTARERFSIARFARDWTGAFRQVCA